MSADLQWMIIRNNSSFLVKGNGVCFTKEPNNLRNRNSFRYNGLIHKKSVAVASAADNKGVVLLTKNSKNANKPSKQFNSTDLKKGPRQTLTTIRKVIRKNRYRKDLKMAALRRASAILASQRAVVVKKAKGKKKV